MNALRAWQEKLISGPTRLDWIIRKQSLITFEDLSQGTPVRDQYSPQGVYFSDEPPFYGAIPTWHSLLPLPRRFSVTISRGSRSKGV